MSDTTITYDDSSSFDEAGPREQIMLVLTWCGSDPSRVGEVIAVPGVGSGVTATLGRGEASGLSLRAKLVRQRPARNHTQGPLEDRRISRDQLALCAVDATAIQVRNVGRCRLLHNGVEVTEAVVRPGDTVTLRKAVQMVCVVRRTTLPPAHDLAKPSWPEFGAPDAHGMVGESAAAWSLRDRVAFVAKRPPHVLITGASGTGKELVARAVHALSPRVAHRLVSRNAATIPEGLVDAELFGNVRDYPNPGMRERRGLFGEADRSTLFLDEIGEVPASVQAHLLRALDEGEVHRLGGARPDHVDVRVLAATNRDASELKHDMLARLKLRIEVPDLNARREDVPLLVRHLLVRIAADDPAVQERFFDGDHPRVSTRLIGHLVRRNYVTHVRELEVMLWQAIATSPEDRLEWTQAVADVVATGPQSAPDEAAATAPTEVRVQDLTPEQIQASLDAHRGSLKDTWQALGLRNRFQLIRLIKKHGLRKGSG